MISFVRRMPATLFDDQILLIVIFFYNMLSLICMGDRRAKSNANWTGRMVPVTNRPRYELERTVDALNGKFREEQPLGPDDVLLQERRAKETPPHLRELFEAWQACGPDLFKFSCAHRNMWTDVKSYWEEGRRLNPIFLLGAPGGGAGLGMQNRREPDPYKEALRLFIELLLNPACNELAGPCIRCGSYYIRRSVRNKVYCSRSCGTRATALAATRKKRDEEYRAKFSLAEHAAREWATARTLQAWKPWVSRRHPGITVKFLTRAVNSGKLIAPTKEKK